MIVNVADASHLPIGPANMAPSPISRLDTVLEFMPLLAVLTVLTIVADLVQDSVWRHVLRLATLATITLSRGPCVFVRIRKAVQARRTLLSASRKGCSSCSPR